LVPSCSATRATIEGWISDASGKRPLALKKSSSTAKPSLFIGYFEDLGEIDEICLEALKRQSLLPAKPAPIRIERFVEKEFKTALRYEDLGPNNLGCTVFNCFGGVAAIRVGAVAKKRNEIHLTWHSKLRKLNKLSHLGSHEYCLFGVAPPFVKNCTLRGKFDWKRLAPKWSELAISKAPVASPMIISGQVDVFPL
jgi:hypothetical protein